MKRRVDPRFAAQRREAKEQERREAWLKVHRDILAKKGFTGDLSVMSPEEIAEFNRLNISHDDPDMIPREENH